VYSLTEILEATGGRLLLKGQETFSGLSIDSRTIKEGELFIALKGTRFDGHEFVTDALRKAAGAIVSIPPLLPIKGKSIIYVSNTLKALHCIARYRRLKRATEVIAVTGTNGKTTTKEMIARVLEKKYKVLKNYGNLNNHVGLPLCLSQLNGQEVVVLEMGASKVGDIKELCEIALPETGVLTNIGPAHLEGFGTVEQIRNTKLELLEFVGRIIINNDDPLIRDALSWNSFKDKDVITYGINEPSDVMAEDINITKDGINFTLICDGKRFPVKLKVYGRFNVYNALAAASVCRAYGCIEGVPEALESFEGVPMRLEVKHLSDVTFMSDMYNANPASMEEALKELVAMKKNRAIAVLGDMLELGAYEEKAHRDLGKMLARLPIEIFVAVGQRMAIAAQEMKSEAPDREVINAKDAEEALYILQEIIKPNDVVLIKGSRAMAMERIIEDLNRVEV